MTRLTPEQWAEIFARLETDQTDLRHWDARYLEQQRHLHSLKLVCKQFNQVYKAYPQLLLRVSLESLDSKRLPSLARLLQQCKNSLQILEAYCGSPLVDALLATLISPASRLRLADIFGVSNCTVNLVSMFQNLEICALATVIGSNIDLAPLAKLAKLQNLHLEGGEFVNLDQAAHLTRLRVVMASVECSEDCGFAGTLQKLEVDNAPKCFIHTEGLSACTALKELLWTHSNLVDATGYVTVSADGLIEPPDWPLMKQLTKLYEATHKASVGILRSSARPD